MLTPGVRSTCALFFFNDTATTEIYTLSLHDALPISSPRSLAGRRRRVVAAHRLDLVGSAHRRRGGQRQPDRKSTRLNSSHQIISYAVFCLKKKKTHPILGFSRGAPVRPRRAHGPLVP